MWENNNGVGKLFWPIIAGILELFLWTIFLIMLVIIFPFYIIFAPIYYLCVKRDCPCPDSFVNYFRLSFFLSAIVLVSFGTN
jgi:hypothetical protein